MGKRGRNTRALKANHREDQLKKAKYERDSTNMIAVLDDLTSGGILEGKRNGDDTSALRPSQRFKEIYNEMLDWIINEVCGQGDGEHFTGIRSALIEEARSQQSRGKTFDLGTTCVLSALDATVRHTDFSNELYSGHLGQMASRGLFYWFQTDVDEVNEILRRESFDISPFGLADI